MAYRDERDALRQRADGLSDDLEATRRELEAARARLAAHDSKDVDDERRIAELSQRLARLEGRPAPARARGGRPTAVIGLVVGASVVFALLGAVFFVTVAKQPPSDSRRRAQPPSAVTAVAVPPKAQPAAQSRRVVFHAKVTKASGAPVTAGAACTLEALVVAGAQRDVRDLVLSCGGTRLYKRGENDGQTIISSSRWDVEEAAGSAAGRYRYHLLFEDKGQRSSRLYQIFVDTREKRARLWRDEPALASIDLVVDEWSDEHAGDSLSGPAAR